MTAEHTPMTKERLLRYRSLRMENENQLERLARMKSGELFPAIREGEGAQHTGTAGDRLWGDRIFEKCGIRRDEEGDGGKTLEIRGKRRLSARDGGANYQQS